MGTSKNPCPLETGCQAELVEALLSLRLFACCVIVLPVMLGACKKNRDFTKPTIELKKPASHEEILSGGSLTVEADFSDDRKLLSYGLVIKSHAGDHHQKVSHPIAPWTYSETEALSGKSQSLSVSIAVPVNVAAGEYVLTVRCTDDVGNEATPKEVGVIIRNSTDLEHPIISIHSLGDSTPNNFVAGWPIEVQGEVSDNKQLGNMEVFLLNASEEIVFEDDLHLPTNPFAVNLTITAPSVPGMYELRFVCHDYVNNITEQHFDIIVH